MFALKTILGFTTPVLSAHLTAVCGEISLLVLLPLPSKLHFCEKLLSVNFGLKQTAKFYRYQGIHSCTS
jgi:hypothetical protein